MNVAQAKAAARAVGASVVAIDDEQYPPLLRAIHDPPPLLYVRGDPSVLPDAQLAVVGSRRASPAALRVAELLSGQLARAGLHICSGMAIGIDGAAHRGALAAGGRSVAVIATGIDRVYPYRHRALASQLEECGCLVTEFPPGTPPLRQNFPQRNRLISGMSLGVLVIEAALPSGSLITAGTALEQGREVFALPWSVLHEGGRGCLQLIRDGAKMVLAVEDILEELAPLYTLQQHRVDAPSAEVVAPSTSWLLGFVGFEMVTLDELVHRSARPVAQVLGELSVLELGGQVTRMAGGYIRC
ncbi:MAG: DNA-protecting protein DprA [Haliea sp.]|jgi:DNA processing protein|nr:DNA-protecting protein DprA [Haliea sp.]